MAANLIGAFYRYRKGLKQVVTSKEFSRSFAAAADLSFPFEKCKLGHHPLARIENGADKESETSLALVVDYPDFIPYPVQPVVAWNYLFCGFYLLDGFAEARFKVANTENWID